VETAVRLGAFFGIFLVMALWERRAPMRGLSMARWPRWGTNWGISVLDAATVKLVFGAAAAGAALDAAAAGWGLFNRIGWPEWVEFVLTLLAMDLAIWLQHLATHKIPLLWRLHRVHHADRDVDVTTAIRFHPVEIALSMVIKIGLVYALGAPVAAVIAFEVVLNGMAMFNHGNVRMPRRLEPVLRAVIVTPDMHRVHHSVLRDEHDANYGFNLSVWDRIFGTYVPEPSAGHLGMTLGLDRWQDERPTRLGWSLALPFRR